MMRANFKATLLSIVRSPSLLFWPLAFPIILSLVFSMMFSGLEQAYRLQPVSVAVVRDANYDKATGFDELLSSVDDDGDEWHVFDVSSVGSVAEAKRKVVDGDVSGYICLDADANPSLHLSPRASFSLGSGSLTSAQSVLDSYIRVRSEMEDLAKKDPMLLADPTVLQRFSSDAVSTERLSVTANDPKASVRYYYALLGMAAGIGSVLAMKAIRETQANATALGARRTLAGFPRWRVLVSSTAAAWLASYACLAVGFAFIRFVLGVDFGGREGLALLALGAASCWCIYNLFVRKIYKAGFPPLRVTYVIFLWNLILTLPFMALMGYEPKIAKVFEPKYLLNFLFLGVLASSACFFTWNKALELIGGVSTNVYLYFQSVVTAAFAVIFIDEKVTQYTILGMVLVTLGLMLSQGVRFHRGGVKKGAHGA